MFSIPSLVLGVVLSVSASTAHFQYVEPTEWVPQAGDTFTVDTTNNIGYLLRGDESEYTSFRVVTGQRRNVYYIGRYYFAKTPDQSWEVKSFHQKARSVTFGDGRFLRLYNEGERTAYGIHGHRYATEMLSDTAENRYRSMGCIIVSDDMLDVIQETYTLNGDYLQVTTMAESPEYIAEAVEPDWF